MERNREITEKVKTFCDKLKAEILAYYDEQLENADEPAHADFNVEEMLKDIDSALRQSIL